MHPDYIPTTAAVWMKQSFALTSNFWNPKSAPASSPLPVRTAARGEAASGLAKLVLDRTHE